MTKNFLKIMMLLMVASFNLTSCFLIGELTSKSATRAKGPVKETTIFRPNF